MNNNEIKQILIQNSEEKYQEFTSSLIPSGGYRLLGVRIPFLRKLARQLVAEQGIEFLNHLTDDSFEEVLLQGFVIGYAKIPFIERKPYITDYLSKCDSWSLVDSIVTTLKPKKKEREEDWLFLEELKKYDKPYYIRYILVTMLNRYLDDEHIDEVLDYVKSVNSDHYYVEMAQAWLLATACIKYIEKVRSIIENDEVNDFVRNKTIQKAIESYRISDEQKEMLRSLKK